MPPSSPTVPHTFSASEPSCRFNEPYVTGALNRKFYGIVPRGIHRGFELATTGIAYQLSVAPDPVTADHLAVYETAGGYSLTLRKTGAFTVTLDSGYESTTVVVTLYLTYSTTTDTTAVIRVYTEAQFAAALEKDELVVLGTVTVPAGGIVLSSGISPDRRDVAALAAPPPWPQLVPNAIFERSAEGWVRSATNGTLTRSTTSGHKLSDANAALLFTYASGTANFSITRILGHPCNPLRRLQYRLVLKVLQVATAGTVVLRFHWRDGTGGSASTTSVSVAVDATDASHRTVEGMLFPPAGVGRLWSVEVLGSSLTFASTAAAAIAFASLRVFAEPMAGLAEADLGYAEANVGVLNVRGQSGADGSDYAELTLSGTPIGPGMAGAMSLRGHVTDLALLVASVVGGASANLLDPTAAPYNPRFAALVDQSGDWNLVLHNAEDPDNADPMNPTVSTRVYHRGNPGELAFVVNAHLTDNTGPNWEKDVDGDPAFLIRVGQAGVSFGYRYDTDNGLWTDGGWAVESTIDAVTRKTTMRTVEAGMGFNAEPLTARFLAAVAGSGSRTLLLRMGTVRLYVVHGTPNYLELVTNASFDGTDWDFDGAGDAMRLRLGESAVLGMRLETRAELAGGNWADGDWETTGYVRGTTDPIWELVDGRLRFTGTLTASNPAYGATPTPNTLYASNIPKAWGSVSTDGSGGVSVLDGFNIGSVSVVDLSGVKAIQVDMAQPLAAMANACVAASANATVSVRVVQWHPDLLTAGRLYFRVYGESGGVFSALDLTAVAVGFSFTIHGKQS